MTIDRQALRSQLEGQLQEALTKVADEQRKMREFRAAMDEATTTVRSKDRMLSATFDGRGELRELKFHSTHYREMAPAELTNVITTLLREGRTEALGKMSDLPGAPRLPGINLGDVASGKLDPNDMVKSLLGPLLGGQFPAGSPFPGEPTAG